MVGIPVEVGGVRLNVLGVRQSMRMENEFVRREKESAKNTFNTFGAAIQITMSHAIFNY